MCKKITVYFYESESNNKPVLKWLKDLDKKDMQIIGENIKTIEYGFPIGMPLLRVLKAKDNLYEVRSNISNNRKARIIFTIIEERMILLNGFIKKQQKTPKHEIELSLQRKRNIKNL